MLSIEVRLLHGTIRTGSPDDTAMAGSDNQSGEWPPSPARMFAAFVAADGTGNRCRVTDGEELRYLEALPSPVIHASGEVFESALQSRFVVKPDRSGGSVQEYPARGAAMVRPGVKLAPSSPVVSYAWDVDVDPAVMKALRSRAARISYLGCSDSPVHVRVDDQIPDDGRPVWQVCDQAGVPLPVAYKGFLDQLDSAFEKWSSGEPMRRAWIPSRRERYAIAEGTDAGLRPEGTTIWLDFDRRVAPHKVLLVTETLRAAVLDKVDAYFEEGEPGERAPWQLHGHAIPDDVDRPYQLARYLALPNVGARHSDGVIHGAAIWLPPEMSGTQVEAVRYAVLRHLRRLCAPGLDIALVPRFDEGGKWTTRPSRWTQRSRRWFSATPVVAERGRRKGPSGDDVRAWFANAGFPTPSTVRVSPVPTRPGVARLDGGQVHRKGRDRYPYYWLDVVFDEPTGGPVCIGRGRSFGMGLFAPMGGRVESQPPGEAR